MKKLMLIIPLVAIVGCARFSTKQTDLSYDKQGNPLRTITTRATSTTFFESKSSLANFKASQTDKSQNATVGSLNQEASSTNLTSLISVIVEAAVKAGAQSVVPVPVK